MGEAASYPRPELRVITEKEAAERLGVSKATLQRWRIANIGPRYVQLGVRRIGYRIDRLLEWLSGQERGTGSQIEAAMA